MNYTQAKSILEAVLLCTAQPLTLQELQAIFFKEAIAADTLRRMLEDLALEWEPRALRLVQVATGWRFQSRPVVQEFLDQIHTEKPPRYTRSTLETLAIIAYRQPVTRGDIEQIRGVAVNAMALRQLEERGWIEVVGHRDTAGRPALFATTQRFLADLALSGLDQLPLVEVGEHSHQSARSANLELLDDVPPAPPVAEVQRQDISEESEK